MLACLLRFFGWKEKAKEEAKEKGGTVCIKVIAIGDFQDEKGVIYGGWIEPPPIGQPIYDNARGSFLVPLNQKTLEPIIPSSFPDGEIARIKYHPQKCHPLWAVAKTLLFLEDGRVYVWPEGFSSYKENLPHLLEEREEVFSSARW